MNQKLIVVSGLSVQLSYLMTFFLQIDWPDRDGKRHTSDVHGYYFETDYGLEHGLIPSIIYTQTYDAYNAFDLADKGHVGVKAGGALNNCIFKFDFTEDLEDN